MRRAASILASFSLLVSSLCAADDCSAALEGIRSKHHVPAIAAAAIRDNKIVSIGASGLRRLNGSEHVTVDDLWHVGSCAKSMTASLAAILVEQGTIRWEMTVGQFASQSKRAFHEGWKGATLEQLLGHRAGAPHHPPARLWELAHARKGTNEEQRAAFVDGLIAAAPEYSPGAKFIYSNQGYTIASAMLVQATGKPWEELLMSKLFGPLGLKSAGFGAAGASGKEDQPWGHRGEGNRAIPVEPGPAADNPPAIWPGGGVHMSIGDFAEYAGWHAAGAKILKPSTFQKLHSPLAGNYGYGWTFTERPWTGGKVFTHNGTNKMNFAVMWVAPGKNFAVVAACNMGGDSGEKACDSACAALIQRSLK